MVGLRFTPCIPIASTITPVLTRALIQLNMSTTASSASKRRDRFHGAFTGGFSAGFYNSVSVNPESMLDVFDFPPRLTYYSMPSLVGSKFLTTLATKQVGSAEGWTPSSFSSSRNKRAARLEQRPEDFMDDEDGLLTEQLQVPRLLGPYTDINISCSDAIITAFPWHLLEAL